MVNRTEDHARLKEIFSVICDFPIDERAAKAASLTNDEALAQRAQVLAAQMDGVATLHTRNNISHPSQTPANNLNSQSSDPVANIIDTAMSPELKSGDTVGAWRLVSLLGQGGMGSVFLAERNDGHFQQQAAVKILQGMPTEEALALLAKERQILASLTHPNIAHLLDGGATPRGQPYLVIEYVRGRTIDHYCKTHKLSRDDTLQLIIKICEAVAFAHQQLIIHCDVKPSNVLVDDTARPVLLDFGIARLVEQVELVTEDSVITVTSTSTTAAANAANLKSNTQPQTNPRAFTPRYASPEQTRGELIGTATDIYSIGALINQLTFRKPLPDATYVPRNSRDVELLAIIRKATASVAAERYPSAQELSKDIKRYLAHIPVHALPRQSIYTAKKFMQRRWGVVLAGVIFFATIVGFTGQVILERNIANMAEADARSQRDIANAERDVASLERDKAGESQRNALRAESIAVAERDRAATAQKFAQIERDRAVAAKQDAVTQRNIAVEAVNKSVAAEATAKKETETTRAVSEFMESLFAGADPNLNKGEQVTALSIVEQGRDRIENLKDQPEVQANLQASLSRVFDNLGQPKDALNLAEGVVAFEQTANPQRPKQLTEALRNLAQLQVVSSQFSSAEKLAREALALSLSQNGEDAISTAQIKNTLGQALTIQRKSAEAEAVLQDAVRIFATQKNGVESLEYAGALNNLAQQFRWSGRAERSEVTGRQALAIYQRALGADHPLTQGATQSLGLTLQMLRRNKEAEIFFRENLDKQRKIYPKNSATIANSLTYLGNSLQQQGRFVDALPVLKEAMLARDATSSKNSVLYGVALDDLARTYADMGDVANAENCFRESIAIRHAIVGETDIAVTRLRHIFSVFLMQTAATQKRIGETPASQIEARMQEAKTLMLRAYEIRQKVQEADFPEMFDSPTAIAEWDLLNGNVTTAADRLEALKPLISKMRAPQLRQYQRVTALIALKQGDFQYAERGMDQYAIDTANAPGANPVTIALAKLDYAEVLYAINKKTEAARLARQLKASVLGTSDTFVSDAPQRMRLAFLLAKTADVAD